MKEITLMEVSPFLDQPIQVVHNAYFLKYYLEMAKLTNK